MYIDEACLCRLKIIHLRVYRSKWLFSKQVGKKKKAVKVAQSAIHSPASLPFLSPGVDVKRRQPGFCRWRPRIRIDALFRESRSPVGLRLPRSSRLAHWIFHCSTAKREAF